MTSDDLPGAAAVELVATPLWRLRHAPDGKGGAGVVERVLEVPADDRVLQAVVAEAARAAELQGAAEMATAGRRDSAGRPRFETRVGAGRSLVQRLAGGSVPLVEALEIAADVADALAALHAGGLAHCALTPADVWLRPGGGVLLLGCGVRRLLGTVWPGSLDPVSTAYAAPERLLGRPATAAADAWTLAAILVEMVTGRPAFTGHDTAETARAVLEGPLPTLAELRSGVTPELERFLVASLERDPGLRATDMARLAIELRRMTELLAPATEIAAGGGLAAPTGTNVSGVTAATFRAPVLPGDTIGGFKILEQLGQGGMGLVFRAQDRRLERQVALKFLPRVPGAGVPVERFIQEAKAASALDHPNICTIFGVDETPQGDTYIAMALYDGPSLRELLDGGPLPVLEALRVAVQVTSGLAAAHARGIVHCDIKPGNVVLAEDGTAKIVDFGISRMAHSPLELGEGFAGTAGYAAPEQVRREPVDHRVDLWAVGVLLYEMIAGVRPFPGHGARAMMATVEEDPRPLSELVGELPAGLEAVIERALAREPGERYQSASELLVDLDRIPAAVAGRTAAARRRRRLLTASVGAALVLLAFGLWFVRSHDGPGASTGPPRLALIPLQPSPATVADAPPWLAGSLDELLRLELERLGGLEVSTGDPGLVAVHSAEVGFWRGEDRAALDALADRSAARWVAVGTYVLVGPPELRRLELRLAVQPAGDGDPVVAEARGPTTELVATIGELVAAVAPGLGRQPPSAAGPDWQPFAGAEAASLHRDAVGALRVLDSPAARSLLERALALEPANPVLQLSLADALSDLGRDSEAQEQAVAASRAPAMPRDLQLFAATRVLEARRESGPAAAAYRGLWASGQRCAVADETPVDGLVRLATVLVRAGRADEAVVLLEAPPFADDPDPRLDLVRSEAYHWLSRHDPQLAAAERAVRRARAAAQPLLLARALRLQADAEWRQGRLEDGLEALAEARRIYEGAGHRKGEADIATMTGVLLFERGELWQAKAAYDRAAGLYSAIGNRRSQARTLTNKALVLEQQGDLDATIEVSRQALELFRGSGDRVAELISLVNLSAVLIARGRLDEARTSLDEALSTMHEVGRFEAWTLLHDSDLLVATGQLGDAAARLDQAGEIQDATGDRVGRALTAVRSARLLLLQGAASEACARLEQAEPVLAQRGTPLEHAGALRGWGDALRAHGELERSQEVLRRGLEIQSEVTARAGRSETLLSLAATLRELGRSDQAEATAREALADLELRGVVAAIAEGRVLLARLAVDRGDAGSAAAEVARARAVVGGLELPLAQLEVGLVALEVESARSGRDVHEELQQLLAQATARGFVAAELEVMLALGRDELAAGHRAAGRARLEGAAADARIKGLVTTARRAEALLAADAILPPEGAAAGAGDGS